MKKFLLISLGFICILVLSMLYFHERQDRVYYEGKYKSWKTVAETEREMPNLNEKAKKFIEELNRGEHKKYLTGDALDEYRKALEDDSSLEYENEENYTETGKQDLDILLSSTKNEDKNKASSTVIYQLKYKGVFDNKETGTVDQRILTFVMNIKWVKESENYMVDQYELNLLEDNMGSELSSNLKGEEVQ